MVNFMSLLKVTLNLFSSWANFGPRHKSSQINEGTTSPTHPQVLNRKSCFGSFSFRDEEFIQQLLQILEAHYEEEGLTIPQIAAFFPMHESHLRRRMLETLGKSPQAYLIEFRLAKAKEKLNHPEWSIKRICFDCGFKTEAHFSHAFKRKYGLSPQNFRKKERGER
jgi:AraC-like DNA-binding protein